VLLPRVSIVPSEEMDPDIAAAIAQISQGPNGEVRVRLHDKHAALVSIGKHLGMFTDVVQMKTVTENATLDGNGRLNCCLRRPTLPPSRRLSWRCSMMPYLTLRRWHEVLTKKPNQPEEDGERGTQCADLSILPRIQEP
jgi:hypothetical protein